MTSKALLVVLAFFGCIFILPVVFGIIGGLFGIVVGVFGAVFGVIAGVFGAVFGVIGAIFDGIFGFAFSGGTFFAIVLLIVVLVTMSGRRKSRY